jgi:23S rRNA (uracil-5-)-methyltransferase RumA
MTTTTPACPHFTVCGGCQSQHITYEQQVENKKARLASLLKPYFGGDIATFFGEPYGYRNRMDFVFGGSTLGFRKAEGGGLVAVQACPISDTRVAELGTEVREWFRAHSHLEAFDHKRHTGALRYATIRTSTTGTSIIFMLSEDSTKLAEHTEAIEQFARTTRADNVIVAYTPAAVDESLSTEYYVVKGSEYIVDEFCGVELEYHALAFFQNNPHVAEQMVTHVKDELAARSLAERAVVDAYGGVGTFGVVLAPHCKEVISIESHPLSSECASRNAERLALKNMRAITDDSANLRKHELPKDAFYLVDPPRSGMSEKALRALLATNTDVIVYVSCNPAALAKELVLLTRNYTVASAALFDMFPQTNHIEAVVVLERKRA